jgi:hypothetical protein
MKPRDARRWNSGMTMNDDDGKRRGEIERRNDRRWLIGVGISVVFGTFGVVMALLDYLHRTASAPPATGTAHRGAAGAPPPAVTPVDHGRKSRRQDK